MRISFDKAACQNTRRALQKEWLLTNGLGDYASSTMLYCNTRKYHGLLIASTRGGRKVLLSAMEESITGAGKEFFISARQHPGKLYPGGHQYLESFVLEPWPIFTYRVGDVRLRREMILARAQTRLLIRWTLDPVSSGRRADTPGLTLRLKPLLAYRGFHELTHANEHLSPHTDAISGGFAISPYDGFPAIYFQVGGPYLFQPKPDWYYNVEYLQEHERGFPYTEDLFQPGIIDIPLPSPDQGGSVCLSVGTQEIAGGWQGVDELWRAESTTLRDEHMQTDGIIAHLEKTGAQFLVEQPSGRKAVIAGYHWFDAWGRDTLIALPGLTFYSGRTQAGLDVLAEVPDTIRNGLVPNCFDEGGAHAYNSADAALWYAFALQCFLKNNPDGYEWVREHAWPALKAIVTGYRKGPGMGIYVDENGLLHAGNAETQLTWMDAMADGRPVTPRHGCPVELNALWYNTLAFADSLAGRFGEPEWQCTPQLRALRTAFFEHFWVAREGGYLGDVWRDGMLDQSIRPNQIFAVSLPYPVLEEHYRPNVVECVRNKLLTPFGLRTLAPGDPEYRGRYEGSPSARDSAYHQGTVWPWLLGHYTDALLRVAWDINGAAHSLLDKVTPLFSEHLADAGLGCISEIFDGSPPARPNGCVSQAWSVAECLRMLITLREAAPEVYAAWERRLADRMASPLCGDTAGICRISMDLPGSEDAKDSPAGTPGSHR